MLAWSIQLWGNTSNAWILKSIILWLEQCIVPWCTSAFFLQGALVLIQPLWSLLVFLWKHISHTYKSCPYTFEAISNRSILILYEVYKSRTLPKHFFFFSTSNATLPGHDFMRETWHLCFFHCYHTCSDYREPYLFCLGHPEFPWWNWMHYILLANLSSFQSSYNFHLFLNCKVSGEWIDKAWHSN